MGTTSGGRQQISKACKAKAFEGSNPSATASPASTQHLCQIRAQLCAQQRQEAVLTKENDRQLTALEGGSAGSNLSAGADS
jgi:hypothetical protein